MLPNLHFLREAKILMTIVLYMHAQKFIVIWTNSHDTHIGSNTYTKDAFAIAEILI